MNFGILFRTPLVLISPAAGTADQLQLGWQPAAAAVGNTVMVFSAGMRQVELVLGG
jgi:hypothetical protein